MGVGRDEVGVRREVVRVKREGLGRIRVRKLGLGI